MKTLQPGIMTLDDLAKWCAMPKGKLQNYIAWCFKWFTDVTNNVDVTDNVDHGQQCSRLNDA